MRVNLLGAGLVALAIASCTAEPVSPTHASTGGVKVLLTDSPFPFDLVARADLYVVRVAAGLDSGSTGADCSGATTIARPNRRFDLLTLQQGTTALLGTGSLPSGSYGAVCVTINTDSSSLTLKTGQLLTHATDPGINWSGSGERVIKADIYQPIPVVDTAGTFLIHFDVGNSFIPAADVLPAGPAGWYYYVPAMAAMDPVTVGSISGTVVGGESEPGPVGGASVRAMVGDSLMDPGSWFVAATGATDSLGHFDLAYLAPSSHWAGAGWVYIVEAYPPSTAGLGVRRIIGVTVNANTTTALATITLP